MTISFARNFSKIENSRAVYEWVDIFFWATLILSVAYLSLMTQRISLTRFFNFDEFQVLYASSALIRGKALYGDQIGNHFPLVNILISSLIKIFGFKTSTVFVVRHFILLVLFTVLVFIFKIAKIIWGKSAGLLAVALTMTCLVFVDKGIEIRHDVFNMTFITIGAYYTIRYMKEEKGFFLCLSGLSLGLAMASTQKAVMWSAGIIIGLLIHLIQKKNYHTVRKVVVAYAGTTMIPLLIAIGFLFLISNENILAVVNVSVGKALGYLYPKTANAIYPFPHRNVDIVKSLIYENGFFYGLALCALLQITRFLSLSTLTEGEVVVRGWAVFGLLFYFLNSRPFPQSLLPSIPALGILASGLVVEQIHRFKSLSGWKQLFLGTLIFSLLIGWPSYLIAQRLTRSTPMSSQLQNISFCLNNLRPGERVFCFTQQQVFWDPVLSMRTSVCGRSIFDLNPACFEKEMIKQKCKVVIFDHRTKALKKEIKAMIYSHYLRAGVADIFVPGWFIESQSDIEKNVWIPGTYYSPTLEICINGRKIKQRLIELEQKTYQFRNLTDRPVFLFYIFDKKKFINNYDTAHLMGSEKVGTMSYKNN